MPNGVLEPTLFSNQDRIWEDGVDPWCLFIYLFYFIYYEIVHEYT